jgi:hypothetical protein
MAHGRRKSGDGVTSVNNTLHTGGFDALFAYCMATSTTPKQLLASKTDNHPYNCQIWAGGDDLLIAHLNQSGYRAPPIPKWWDAHSQLLGPAACEIKDLAGTGLGLLNVHVPLPEVKRTHELARMYESGKLDEKAKHPDWTAYGVAYGLKKKANIRDIDRLEFYSCRAWPVTGMRGRVLGPKPGRVLSKFLVTCDKPDNLSDHEYVRGVLASVQHSWHHVPILRIVWALFSDRYGPGPSKYVPPMEWHLVATTSYDMDETRAAYMFYQIYGLSLKATEQHILDLYKVAKAGQTIDSPILRKIVECDAPIDA